MKKKLVTCLLAAMYGSIVLSFSAFAAEADTNTETELTTEAESASETESEAVDSGSSELSDDLYSFQLKINSDVYSFPMSYDDFLALGWTYKDDETMEIQPNSYSPSERFSLDDLEIYATVVNLGINTEPVTKCTIAGISVDSFQMADATDVTIELPGGIQYGVSTLDDITAAYGTPSDTYEGDLYTKVTYEKDYYQDVELYENHVYTSISTEELEMAIKLEDQEKVQKEVEKLVTQLEESHYNFNAYQSAILEIIFSISGIFRQYHMMDDEIFADAKRMTMKVLSLETGEQLNAWLLNYCDYIIYAIHQRKVDRNSILAQKAMEYVQQHYGNAELSVDEVCAYLHVSTSHFSNLFRKETGMSFLAFLTKKRMDEAVRLLKTTDEKSRVIGEMVGYPEPNYFSYVFKKNMGMSPAKFRKELATEN